MTPAIRATALGRRYRGQVALANISLVVEPGTVTGLLGRNGAGKTTLMRIIAGQEFPTSGHVEVFGAAPAENETALRRMIFVRDDQSYPDLRVHQVIRVASWFYPNWSSELSGELLAEFGVPPGRRIRKLSRGMRSAVGIVIGLAARAELTLLDEPYAGLDAVARQLFYGRLHEDLAGHPRAIVLSTHLIDEVEGLLDQVLMLEDGRAVLNARAAEARAHALNLSLEPPSLQHAQAKQGRRERGVGFSLRATALSASPAHRPARRPPLACPRMGCQQPLVRLLGLGLA